MAVLLLLISPTVGEEVAYYTGNDLLLGLKLFVRVQNGVELSGKEDCRHFGVRP